MNLKKVLLIVSVFFLLYLIPGVEMPGEYIVYSAQKCVDTPCSYVSKCPKKHCDVLVCSVCGSHKNDANCGGDCDNNGYCKHCSVTYCSICNDHECVHDKNGYCQKPHCESRIYCSKCGHTCDGDHVYGTLTCSKAHCDILVCTVAGCNEHKDGALCGGDHNKGEWTINGNDHNRYCGVENCGEVVESHVGIWGAADGNHLSVCVRGCNLTYTHQPVWGEYTQDGSKHSKKCTVTLGGALCQAKVQHDPRWSEYQKLDNGGDESGAFHVKKCLDCGIIGESHGWADDTKWRAINESEHKRTCSICGVSQILPHDFIERRSIDGDLEKHYKICTLCVDDDDNSYGLYEKHVDAETDGRGNGVCDLCNKELWSVTKSISVPTNHSVSIEVNMFSAHDDKMKLPSKVTDANGDEILGTNGKYDIDRNGKYIFYFECPDRNVMVEVDNISFNIYGRIFATPDTSTTGNVTLKLVTSKEGIDKTIDVKYENEEWENDTLEIEREVSNNGEYTFYARDSLGNSETYTFYVDNIVSGFGSVTTTFDVFQNGYVFTDILVNVNQAWVTDDALINCLNGSIYKYKVDSDGLKTNADFNKVQIVDSLGNRVTEQILSSGVYYLRVAIGGSNMFTDVGTYMIEIKDVTVKVGENTLITLSGKNRIEVVVQSLNDLT